MSRKLTYPEIKNKIENDIGHILESTEYVNNKTKLKIRCPNGHLFKMCWNSFNQGQRCSQCFGNKKHTIEYIKNDIEYYNYECISNIYINANIKLQLKCPNNHLFKITYNHFKRGNRCPTCFGKEKHTIEFVKEYCSDNNYICESNEYINAKTKLKLICPNGHKIEMNFNNFKSGYRCKECYTEKNRAENRYNWNLDRTRKTRSNYLSFDLRKKSILKEDLNYKNYLNNKDLYEIDHIFPRIAFIDNELDKQYNPIIIKEICNSIDNLQIITKEENRKKSSKYNQEEFMSWFDKKIKEKNLKPLDIP